MEDPNDRTTIYRPVTIQIGYKTIQTAWLEGLKGEFAGVRFPIEKSMPLVIGRGSDCAIRLGDARVSRKHTQVELTDGTYHLQDLESTNGTFVNQVRVAECILHEGDLIQSGDTVFRFRSAAAIVQEGQ